jgi:hypothetical protein
MPKMQLDQRQPAKANAKTMAQRKKAKMLKENAKLEELRKQFPKLFSPDKVKNIEQRKKRLVQSSFKKAICPEVITTFEKTHPARQSVLFFPEEEDEEENMPENTRNRKPFASPPAADTPKKKGNKERHDTTCFNLLTLVHICIFI